MDQSKMPLYEALVNFSQKERYSLHVPGHKNGRVFPKLAYQSYQEILSIDLTELEGLDDLHSPSGVIKEAQALLTEYYQTQQSYFLINGSTVGNLTMVLASCSPGDLVFVQRNAHKSIFNALRLANVQVVLLNPETIEDGTLATGLSLETVKEALKRYPNAKALILTYPNYYGQAVPIQSIIEVAHRHGLGVLVDEAHGPHFKWGAPFPKSSLDFGADLVVHSAHKMLPAMTMGAYLHLNSSWVSQERVQSLLSTLQSSSPSYPIMGSLDVARSFLATLEKHTVDALMYQVEMFQTNVKTRLGWSIREIECGQVDPLKLTLHVPGYSGFQLKTAMESIGYYPELADPNHVLVTFGLDDHTPFQEILAMLINLGIKPKLPKRKSKGIPSPYKVSPNSLVLSAFAEESPTLVRLVDAVGLLSGETVVPYPPGIPILLKGETITEQHIVHIQTWKETRASFQGDGRTTQKDWILVLKP